MLVLLSVRLLVAITVRCTPLQQNTKPMQAKESHVAPAHTSKSCKHKILMNKPTHHKSSSNTHPSTSSGWDRRP
jgi:hypothetical protein